MSKRSSKQSSSSPVVRFLKEWGLFSIIVGLIIASRIYLWAPVKVDGHSMDPTLADSEYLLVVNHLSIDRFDIVVASEKHDHVLGFAIVIFFTGNDNVETFTWAVVDHNEILAIC